MSECPVLRDVVGHDLCIGCGTCAAICPRGRLSIGFDNRGFYTARERDEAQPCADSCSLCSRVCPFADGNPNEDSIAAALFGDDTHTAPQLGRFRSCFVGWSARGAQREDGASGGLATWFLTELLRRGEVDRVICVARRPGPEPLFAYKVCASEQEVEDASRSAYYPVEMSAVLGEMLSTDGRYAIVCLPCFAKAVRLAADVIPRIKERLVCVAGLVCGHTVSAFFAEYAAALGDPHAGPPSCVIFRAKDPRFPATEHATICRWNDRAKTVMWSEGLGEALFQNWFTPNPCFYCDDIFAETADAVFMDAWLPEYSGDYRGTSIVVTRSRLADAVVRTGLETGDTQLKPCTPDEALRSQASTLEFKCAGLSHRLALAREAALHTPVKRVAPLKANSPDSARKWTKHLEAAQLGPRAWRETRKPHSFRARMREYGWPREPAETVTRRALSRMKRMLWKK